MSPSFRVESSGSIKREILAFNRKLTRVLSSNSITSGELFVVGEPHLFDGLAPEFGVFAIYADESHECLYNVEAS